METTKQKEVPVKTVHMIFLTCSKYTMPLRSDTYPATAEEALKELKLQVKWYNEGAVRYSSLLTNKRNRSIKPYRKIRNKNEWYDGYHRLYIKPMEIPE